MKAGVKGFRSEAELVRRGRRLIRQALRNLEKDVRTRYEVPAPGGVPDLVIFSKNGQAVRYVVTVEFKLGDWQAGRRAGFPTSQFRE
jgi:hypothetical protein